MTNPDIEYTHEDVLYVLEQFPWKDSIVINYSVISTFAHRFFVGRKHGVLSRYTPRARRKYSYLDLLAWVVWFCCRDFGMTTTEATAALRGFPNNEEAARNSSLLIELIEDEGMRTIVHRYEETGAGLYLAGSCFDSSGLTDRKNMIATCLIDLSTISDKVNGAIRYSEK